MCTQLQLQQVLSDAQKGLAELFGPQLERVLLYGSYARGDQDEESDIDVMALVDMPREQLEKYRRAISRLSTDIDLQHDVFLSIKLQDTDTFHRWSDTLPFFRNVIEEGIVVGQ